ncbi:dynein regulatory complex subunit 7 isoform X2 [Melanotaenia boesemani]|uniref:dynein regulatory complex subunit 7 isoform X2 n=1 Tax=Melanotaenia boesemani TaxID=1250792 RepID=UPI001C0433F7|nr:dynein regulatory complex subunit 7 isoform X2 [Melanotaenia boesemani]
METEPEFVSCKQMRSKEDEKEEKEKDITKQTTLEQTPINFNILKPQELCVPESYRTNSPRETQLLAMADNFQRQYLFLHPDRKPLLLCPLNECGVRKFVSTSLCPTTTSHCEFQTWQGCASFVADFLSLDPLEPPADLPKQLFSSTSVLQSQQATCFEFATLLCSLLLGVNYDAYCVSGYAVREMCLLDQSLQQCPLLEVKSELPEQEQQENGNSMKPLREIKSRFLTQQEKKKQEAEAEQKLKECEQQPADFLRGLRVHCWVLVLSGSHSIQENFFIDPLTGNSYPTDNENFLGIESVWNNFNYYVNMQDCRNSCTSMVFDLEDLKMWTPVLYGATNRKQLVHDVLEKKESKKQSQISSEEQPRVFEMPRSWLSYITISKKDLEKRWPGGKKVIRYRKAKLEKFAPGLNPDGLITRLTTYKDLDCTEVAVVKEWYKYRCDKLEEKEINKLDNSTAERFGYGRSFQLLFHRCRSLTSGIEQEMEFSSSANSLVRRLLSPTEMKEHFEGRGDFLRYRHVLFSQHRQPHDKSHLTPELKHLHVLKVVERFSRNKSKPANEDVAERVFLVPQGRFELTYHLMDHRFIPSKRSFVEPAPGHQFTQDLVTTFQVRDIVACREKEEGKIELWTKAAATQALRDRKNREILAAEKEKTLQEDDVLAPFLIQLGNPETLNPDEAKQVYQSCLAEFKDREAEQILLLQQRCDKETEELQAKQKWYQQSHQSLSQQQAEDYQKYCSQKIQKISVIQKRFHRQREMAGDKYNDLIQKLQRHPRLAAHLSS